MTYEQKMEYVKNYLQQKLEEEFVYPFRVNYEENQLVFSMKNGKTDCRTRTRDSNEIVHTILNGDEVQKENLVKRIFQILQAAITAQESTALSDISDYEKIKEVKG